MLYWKSFMPVVETADERSASPGENRRFGRLGPSLANGVPTLKRAGRFLLHLWRLRSVSAARWVDDYEQADQPLHGDDAR